MLDALEKLDRVFSRYPRKLSVAAASADDDLDTKGRLAHKRLRELDPSDAMDATSYCASARSLKHFVPRMLELGVRPDGGALLIVVNAGLASARWSTWPPEERAAIDAYLAAHGHRAWLS